MRLIDADELQNGLDRLMEQGELSYNIFKAAVDILDIQPTAYDVDKVVEQLGQKEEDAKKYWQEFDDEDAFGEMNAYRNAIQIVKSGGIE